MYFVGIDLGGMGIKTGIIDENLNLCCKTSLPTIPQRGFSSVAADMAESLFVLAQNNGIALNQIAGIGVGIPGFAHKELSTAVNLYWLDVPLKAALTSHIDVPVYINNDANVAAVYEYHLGSLKGSKVGVLLTLGTGVGGGIVIDGKPFSGAHGMGGEIGHIEIVPDGTPCSCGNRGCLETYASALALTHRGRLSVVERPESMMHHQSNGDLNLVTAKLVIDCAKQGDFIANAILDEYVKFLAMGIGSIKNLFDPDIIAIGGGVAAAGDFLLDKIIENSKTKGVFAGKKYADIKLATGGNDAGIIGAAMLALNK